MISMASIQVKGPIPSDSDNYYRYLIWTENGERQQKYLGPADGKNDKNATKEEIPEKFHDEFNLGMGKEADLEYDDDVEKLSASGKKYKTLDTDERVKVNKENFENPRLMIDVGKKPGYDSTLTVRTPDGDQIQRIPKDVKSWSGRNYKTDKKGDNRFWRYPTEAPQKIDYYYNRFRKSSKYRVISYQKPDWKETDWKMQVERIGD